jgi:predicted permease
MAFLSRLRALLQRPRVARELDDELAFHLEMETQAHIARGVRPDEARRRALATFGGVVQTREAVRDVRALSIESLWQDMRYAGRTLGAAPGFTLAAAGMLALAIGITTAMFTVLDSLILRPVPFRDPDQLARVHLERRPRIPPTVLRAWRESPAFEAAELARRDSSLVEAGATVVTATVATVTPGVFDMLDARPIRGRLFDDSARDGVLMSETLWRSLFDADPAVIGRAIRVDRRPLTIVGILPAHFRFPTAATALWRRLEIDNAGQYAYVRFAKGLPREEAVRLAVDAAEAVDPGGARVTLGVYPLAGAQDTYSTRAVPLLAAGVGLVFLILCANVCSLLLARLTARRREFSMRAALGASRGRLVRQALVESGALGVLGIAGGVGLAWALVSLARALLPEVVVAQSLNPLALDGRAMAVSSAAGCAGTLLAGLLPAWLGTRFDAQASLRVIDRGTTESRGARALTRTLLVGEVALACTLLLGGALLVRSFVNLVTADRGLQAAGVSMMWINLRAAAPADPALEALVRAIEDDLRGLPGVQLVAWSYGVPPRGGVQGSGDWFPDAPNSAPISMHVDRHIVSAEYFQLYGIQILKGRTFEPSDPRTSVIVSERFAQALWPDADAVGRTFRVEDASLQVIGLAREIHYPSVDRGVDVPEIYHPFTLQSLPMVSVRCHSSCPDSAVFRHLLAVRYPEVRVQSAGAIERDYARELAWPRVTAALAGAFAVIAVLASAGGLFSVLLYTVGRRRREFGIRTALGASPAQLRKIVLGDGLTVTVLGIVLGSVAALSLTRVVESMQYGVTMSDGLSWAIVLGLLVTTTLAAAWRPARTAARIDPVVLLREE